MFNQSIGRTKWQCGAMRKILPLLLLVLGLVTLGVAVAQGVGGFVGSLQSVGQPWVAPQASTQDLTAGAYVVYEQSATRTLGAQDVTVTGPAGAVTVNSTISSTLTLGDVTYVGIAGFTAPQDGTYTIEVAGDGQQLVLGPALGKTIGSAFLWIGVASLGGLLALAGGVWLVVALVIGGRETAGPGIAPVGAAMPQQGSWYPDPEDPSQWRWWDGRQWTDERAPRT